MTAVLATFADLMQIGALVAAPGVNATVWAVLGLWIGTDVLIVMALAARALLRGRA